MVEERIAAGQWLATETTWHINKLELLAMQKTVVHFLPLIRGKVVMFHSDNSSAFAYLQNQGGTHSLPMFRLTWNVLLFCQQHGITLLVGHIPGRLNVLADSLKVEKASDHRHGVVSAPQHSVPNVLHLVHSRAGPVCNSSQQQADGICVSSARSSGSSDGCSVNSVGQVVGICLSPNSVDAASASQVGSLRSVLNASSGSTSALPAVASNASQLVSI